jgi:transposase
MSKNTELSIEQRWAIVALDKYTNKNQTQIANAMKIHQQNVSDTLIRYKETGDVKDRPGRGAKPLVDIQNVNNNPVTKIQRAKRKASARTIQHDLETDYDINISLSTVYELRKQLGFRGVKFHRRSKFGPETKEKRLYFCLDYLESEWKDIIFTDEKWFVLDDSRHVIYKRPNSPAPENSVVQHPEQIMVWGGIWFGGRTKLAFLDGNVDGTKYREVVYKYLIETHLNDEMEILQDGARAHTSDDTMEFFDRFGVDIIQNPPSSPDLNPIEKVWSWIAQQIGEQTVESIEEMVEWVQYYWEKCPQTLINNWIRHNKTVVNDIIASGGGTITEQNRSKRHKPIRV